MGIRMGASHNPRLYRGTIDAFTRITREEGIAGIYSGLGPSLIGEAVFCCCFLFCFES